MISGLQEQAKHHFNFYEFNFLILSAHDPRILWTCKLKVARNSFHFLQTSFTNSFSKYSLVYRISLKFTTVTNETS